MPPETRKHNRGPAAGPENRRAVLTAARQLFAERGYHVALKAIASAAGVGQGVLYRHFPTRLDLAFAVFEENFAELETIAAVPDAEVFGRLWARLLDLTIEESAFVEMVVDARRSQSDYEGGERLRALLEGPLARAREAGLVDPGLTPDDVMLAQRMVHGVVVTSLDREAARESLEQALALLAPSGLKPRG